MGKVVMLDEINTKEFITYTQAQEILKRDHNALRGLLMKGALTRYYFLSKYYLRKAEVLEMKKIISTN